jgi:hypothetical protein
MSSSTLLLPSKAISKPQLSRGSSMFSILDPQSRQKCLTLPVLSMRWASRMSCCLWNVIVSHLA